MTKPTKTLLDRFNRPLRYLRLSVTDRCDFRCTYCMAEDMHFLPRADILSFEELRVVASVFVGLGVNKIRVTGGEPLIRQDIVSLLGDLAVLPGLDELCLTTNGSRLREMADDLRSAGVARVNISLDSLKPERFRQLTRHGNLHTVLEGIERAKQCGFTRLKLNAVIQRHRNLDEILDLVDYALANSLDISFIEEMPLGEVHSHSRSDEYVSSDEIREIIDTRYPLKRHIHTSGGPARYWSHANEPSRIGFISPHSHNFCGDCNRVRLTASGRLLLCLGHEHSVDLRRILRDSEPEQREHKLEIAIREAMLIKPERHEFSLSQETQVLRFMNATGG